MNRSGIYGDLIFESIKVEGLVPKYLDLHYKRLAKGIKVLKFVPEGFDFDLFEYEILMAVKKYRENKPISDENLRVRFVVFREANGFYLPDSNRMNYEVEVFPIPPYDYGSREVRVYPDQRKAPGVLANIKTGYALIYVMAKIWAQERGLFDALILNTNGNIIESSSSNIFWEECDYKTNKRQWYTPPLSDGCVEGVMREVFMKTHSVIEKSCVLSDIINAEELLLTNAIRERWTVDHYEILGS